MTAARYGIHWFRRDLRLRGNPALRACHDLHEGRVLGVFLVDPGILAREDLGAGRFALILEALVALGDEMRERGGELRVIEGSPEKALPKLVAELERGGLGAPAHVSFNRDYEPYALARDARVERLLREELGIETLTEADHLLLEPAEVVKPSDGSGYRVFTPFKKRWLAVFESEEHVREKLKRALDPLPSLRLRFPPGWKIADALEDMRSKVGERHSFRLPEAGEKAALSRTEHFIRGALADYGVARDLPAVPGTSQLSIHLKHGAVTTAQILAMMADAKGARLSPSAAKFREELIWREFYYHLLYRHPRVEIEPFNRDFAKLKWVSGRQAEEHFKAWCEGRTGYPIVDAAMRQLNETGWMHNRMRMVTASFLTKHLLIDYRWGERYFMQQLLDGDLAPNNGGWQWAASTGCDPQPWFRVFNPSLQARHYDPREGYVKHWLPDAADRERKPIVEHGWARERALRTFKEATMTARKRGNS